jgi:CRISPR-associated endonuclease/helicase Cas3
MSEEPLAHSARKERGIPAQGFWAHIGGVERLATEAAKKAAGYWTGKREQLVGEVRAAAVMHDCGKLWPESQRVLRGSERERLGLDHADAGTALLLGRGREIAAVLVKSHHAGLPSMPEERRRVTESPPVKPFRNREELERTEQHEEAYRRTYEARGVAVEAGRTSVGDWSGLTHRIALSCLVDGDHSDTARHYGEPAPGPGLEGRWAERLEALDRFVRGLQESGKGASRRKLRAAMYEACRDAPVAPSLRTCEAPVGTGKTTAVMAHLLRAAQERGLRHIFVVLPFTNIIRQSVQKYREALVLDGENPEEVVAELHHLADFEAIEARHMAALWRAPIIVTTAVQFFETLAGNHPARLRKLHELPGSAVFIDEEHTALPAWLWPQTWVWLKELCGEWGCQVALGSGSLARFWRLADLVDPPEDVPDLLPRELSSALLEAEAARVVVKRNEEVLSATELLRFVRDQPGPRLVIMNTVQNAAVVAEELRRAKDDVVHLSTALAPMHRERIVDRIYERLGNQRDRDWTLVATSCVEAGLDFSFRTAVRESCSVASAIQTGGRTNREGDWSACEVWDVRVSDGLFNDHPGFRASSRVLAEMLVDGLLAQLTPAEAVTEALRREVLRYYPKEAAELKKQERRQDFAWVAERYRVIDADTRTVVVDRDLIERLHRGDRVSSRELVRGSVQMWAHKIETLRITEFGWLPGLYEWTGPYDEDFLGYMAGVLPLIYAGQSSAHFV